MELNWQKIQRPLFMFSVAASQKRRQKNPFVSSQCVNHLHICSPISHHPRCKFECIHGQLCEHLCILQSWTHSTVIPHGIPVGPSADHFALQRKSVAPGKSFRRALSVAGKISCMECFRPEKVSAFLKTSCVEVGRAQTLPCIGSRQVPNEP